MKQTNISFYEELSKKLHEDIETVNREETSNLKISGRCVRLVRAALTTLRNYVISNPFKSAEEEIHFFKEYKPSICSELIYYGKTYSIECHVITGSAKARLKYLNQELARIDQFYTNYPEYIRYHRTGASHRDESFFIRGNQDPQYSAEIEYFNVDADFSTGYDILFSKIMANDKILVYLNERIEAIKSAIGGAGAIEAPHNSIARQIRKFAQTSFGGAEVYVFLKALVDAEGVVNHTYKSFFELVAPGIANKQEKIFSPQTLLKKSDKVDYQARENVKRLLQKMIRNVDN